MILNQGFTNEFKYQKLKLVPFGWCDYTLVNPSQPCMHAKMLIIRNLNRINSNTFLEEQKPILNDNLSFWTEQKIRKGRLATKPSFFMWLWT